MLFKKKQKKLTPEQEKNIREALSNPVVKDLLLNLDKNFDLIESTYLKNINQNSIKKESLFNKIKKLWSKYVRK